MYPMPNRLEVAGVAVGTVALIVGLAGLLSRWPFVPASGEPIPGETWTATAHGDGVVTLDRERKLLTIDVNALPQDFLICIGAACRLPAEWRAPESVVYGPGPGRIDVLTSTGELRTFTVSTVPGTAGVIFAPEVP